jgi:hypothetical protein
MDEEEFLNLKDQEKDVEILNNSHMCEIFVYALASLSAPQTLNIARYIKKKMVMVHIDSGRTHNFIDKTLSKSLNFFVYIVTNFQVLVDNGGSIYCGGK